MAINQNQRPKYFEEQYLGAADLNAAVDYGRIEQARHLLGGHTWGIAIGLELVETPQPGGGVTVNLMPGYAWDGYGRPIVVLSPYRIPEALFDALKLDPNNAGTNGILVEVWLRYDETATQSPRPGFENCTPGDQFARIQESFRIEIGDKTSPTDRYSGITVGAKTMANAQNALQAFDTKAPLVEDESIPEQTLPDPQNKPRWLIPIGYVRWMPVQNGPGHFVQRDDSGTGGAEKDSDKIRRVRRYIGIVAEEIEAADRVIRLRDRGSDPTKASFQYPTVGSINDLVWVEGNLRVVGDGKLCEGKLHFLDKQGDDRGASLRIQRYEDATKNVSVFQVTVGPESPAKDHRFAVGPLKADGTVNERFTVLSNGNVGIGTSAPKLKLEIQGDDFGREDGPATLHLWGSTIGDTGGKILFLRAVDGGVVTFDGGNNRVGVGTNQPVAKLEVAGDFGIQQISKSVPRVLPAGATMFWNDGTWLRLNQNLDFSKPIFGVHTPGVFAPESLNVGGAGGWGDPGPGNVWVTGRVGIGTTTPQTSLQVKGGAIMPEVGNSSSAGIQFPSDPGGGAGDEAFIRYFVQAGETTKLLIGINNDADDTLGFHQFGSERMTIRSGNVGVGTTDPQALLHVAGEAMKPGSNTWTNPSDSRLKKNIKPLTGVLEQLLRLRGVRFEWREPEKMGNLAGPQIGMVAQEVEAVFPDWVSTSRNGYKNLTVRGFEALTIEALRELHTQIEELKKRLAKSGARQPEHRERKKKEPKGKST